MTTTLPTLYTTSENYIAYHGTWYQCSLCIMWLHCLPYYLISMTTASLSTNLTIRGNDNELAASFTFNCSRGTIETSHNRRLDSYAVLLLNCSAPIVAFLILCKIKLPSTLHQWPGRLHHSSVIIYVDLSIPRNVHHFAVLLLCSSSPQVDVPEPTTACDIRYSRELPLMFLIKKSSERHTDYSLTLPYQCS